MSAKRQFNFRISDDSLNKLNALILLELKTANKNIGYKPKSKTELLEDAISFYYNAKINGDVNENEVTKDDFISLTKQNLTIKKELDKAIIYLRIISKGFEYESGSYEQQINSVKKVLHNNYKFVDDAVEQVLNEEIKKGEE